MKFARELDDELVPEWRAKYLDYKQCKKKVKAVAAAAARYASTSHSSPAACHLQHAAISSPSVTPLLCEISPPDSQPHTVPSSRHASPPRDAALFEENVHSNAAGAASSVRSTLTRYGSFKGALRSPLAGRQDIGGSRATLEGRKHEFLDFLTQEFDKVSAFYRDREGEATERLEALKEQLYVLREQQAAKAKASVSVPQKDQSAPERHGMSSIRHPIEAARNLRHRNRTPKSGVPEQYHNRDYERRPFPPEVKASVARKKLKRGLREYYRYLELVKSYALINRTAFRKANKKFDKVVKARPRLEFVSHLIDNAYFVKSDEIDKHMSVTEDFYADFFEDGNRKVAVGKLKKKITQAAAYNGSVFRNGLLLGLGLVLGIQGIVSAANILIRTSDSNLRGQTSFLLQLYGGYFLLVFLTLCFCFDCRIFDRRKINYVFVFEFDSRDRLDWRQLCEIPCLFFCLAALTVWLNFAVVGAGPIFVYWPVILIGISALILFLPAPVLYHSSRRWFLASCSRLLGAPFVTVNFRDFFLGDMCCSLTYSFGNVELFFCLYIRHWTDLPICGSSRSRLFGFLQAYPGTIRALQCLRRYYDTKKAFPQLFNFCKYLCTILSYTTLSVWRISRSPTSFATFIAFATVNSVYCSVWDIFMDWSLGQPSSPNKLLRPHLGYPSPWYYAAIPLNVVLRFNWILYVIFANDLEHGSLVSFCVALSEALRRGAWSLFRIENEHCNNVDAERAWRDVDLPYEVAAGRQEGTSISRAHTTDFERRRGAGISSRN